MRRAAQGVWVLAEAQGLWGTGLWGTACLRGRTARAWRRLVRLLSLCLMCSVCTSFRRLSSRVDGVIHRSPFAELMCSRSTVHPPTEHIAGQVLRQQRPHRVQVPAFHQEVRFTRTPCSDLHAALP